MKERPILFSALMVRAILEGRKTQTRRVVKIQPPADDYKLATCISTTGNRRDEGRQRWIKLEDNGYSVLDGQQPYFSFPYGMPGDRLWVRETCRAEELPSGLDGVRYLADDAFISIENTKEASDDWCKLSYYGKRASPASPPKTVPTIHMPRWASRITLEITGVRVERLQDISEADAITEGVRSTGDGAFHIEDGTFRAPDAVECYARLWESINGPDSWEANPWVWVIEFRGAA